MFHSAKEVFRVSCIPRNAMVDMRPDIKPGEQTNIESD
jgi:hypothetical protein